MHTVILEGCAPTPLAHYLKALGILRLIAEQVDASATGCWRRDAFVLQSSLDAEGIAAFFLERYRPTPVLAPWNGGSGFYFQEGKLNEKDPKTGKKKKTGVRDQPTEATRTVERIANSDSLRFECYRSAISQTRSLLSRRDLDSAPKDREKADLIAELRNVWPDESIAWIDCVAVLVAAEKGETESGLRPAYTTLLGSGGNEGNGDFSSNFMQRLCETILPATEGERERSKSWLTISLHGGGAPKIRFEALSGQYFPGSAGGANNTSGFRGKSSINPWDFVFLMEGSLLFAAAAVRKLGSHTKSGGSSPFCVRSAGVGYASAATSDEVANKTPTEELWLPIWERPLALGELSAIFSEGRAHIGKRPASSGVDFARAIVTLGVDRGISAFQRYSFLTRNGDLSFATPLERIEVRPNVRANLLCDIDPWLDRLRRFGADAPASVARAWRGVESAILELCHHDDSRHFRDLLAALGRAERALARSFRWSTGKDQRPPQVRVSPLSRLSAAWLIQADDGSDAASDCEFRLAASLASAFGGALRSHLEPVERGRPFWKWSDNPGHDVCWNEGSLEAVLHAIVARRLATGDKAPTAGVARRFASLTDIETFLHGRTDDDLIADLWWALSAIEWPDVETEFPLGADATPSAIYALLRLCLPQEGELARGDEAVPVVPTIFAKARAGRSRACSEAAVRRLRASGLHPRLTHIDIGAAATRRAVATLLFPLARRDFAHLGEAILRAKSLASR